MSETVKLILSLSVSGGLFAIVLFLLKPFMRNRLSKSFQYYIWVVVLLRFILPLSFGINLMDFTINTPNAPQAADETIIPNNNPVNPANINPAVNNNPVNNNEPIITEQQPQAPASMDSVKPFNFVRMLSDNLLWIWFTGFVLSVAFNILGYLRFIRYVHGVAYTVEIPNCGTKVYKSRFAPTPMLVGVIRPRIYLPDIEYTDEQLNNILLHELTHLRRCDIWLKWFSALVVSVHWFNPIAYFMRREFSRACELSCDEAVIHNLDGAAKQSYGDTLISVVAESRYPVGVMSVTMCEEKKKLKERLIAIMNYKKKTKITVLITAVLAVMITSSAFAFGAGATGGFSANKPQSGTPNIVIPYAVGEDNVVYFDEGNIHFIFIDGANTEDAPTVSVTPGSIAIVLVDKNGYWTFSPYKDISALSDNIKAECIEMINRKENNGFSETHMAHIMKRVESIVNPAAAINPSIEDAAQTIKLADLRQLAAKGYDLTFEDFSSYKGQDVGSGLYILHFNIEGGYTLYVGGGSPTGKPYYAYLSIPGVEGRVDIRYNDISIHGADGKIDRYSDMDDFIGKHPVPNELSAQIHGYLDTIMSSPSVSSATGDYIKAHQAEYDTIVDMGVTALPTLTGILNNGDKGLRGVIAAALVQDIIAEESKANKPQSEWRDGVLQSAASDVGRWSNDVPTNGSPATRDEQPNNSEKVDGSITKNMESIVSTYYSAKNSPAFEMFNKSVFANLADDWTAEIDGIKNPAWNYDSFTSYQILDYNVASVTRHKELYYCTFSADNEKYGYVVMSYDGSSLQKVSVVETPYLYDLQVNIKEVEDDLSETDLDLSSAVASRVKWVDTNKNRSDEVILFTDKNGYVYTIFFFED